MTEKPSAPTPTSIVSKPSKPSTPPPKIGSEQIVVKCGHTITFDLYAKDPYRDQRRVKAVTRDCQPCRAARVQADAEAGQRRRAKKASFAKDLKPRLPDGARFAATFDATLVQWTGTLIVEGTTFERRARSLNKLLYKLDDVYRASKVEGSAVSQESSAAVAVA